MKEVRYIVDYDIGTEHRSDIVGIRSIANLIGHANQTHACNFTVMRIMHTDKCKTHLRVMRLGINRDARKIGVKDPKDGLFEVAEY